MLGFVPLLTKVAHGGNPQDRTFALPNLQISDRANLSQSNLKGANLLGAIMPDGTIYQKD